MVCAGVRRKTPWRRRDRSVGGGPPSFALSQSALLTLIGRGRRTGFAARCTAFLRGIFRGEATTIAVRGSVRGSVLPADGERHHLSGEHPPSELAHLFNPEDRRVADKQILATWPTGNSKPP